MPLYDPKKVRTRGRGNARREVDYLLHRRHANVGLVGDHGLRPDIPWGVSVGRGLLIVGSGIAALLLLGVALAIGVGGLGAGVEVVLFALAGTLILALFIAGFVFASTAIGFVVSAPFRAVSALRRRRER